MIARFILETSEGVHVCLNLVPCIELYDECLTCHGILVVVLVVLWKDHRHMDQALEMVKTSLYLIIDA